MLAMKIWKTSIGLIEDTRTRSFRIKGKKPGGGEVSVLKARLGRGGPWIFFRKL